MRRHNRPKGTYMTTNNLPKSPKAAGLTAALFKALTAAASLTLFSAAALFGTRAFAGPAGYDFRLVATLGDPVPGGRTLINDFEPGAINNRGDIFTGADTGVGAEFQGEGVFLFTKGGQLSVLGLAGSPAPGGGTFSFAFPGPVSLNDSGGAAFAFLLGPFTPPFGVNSGLFRYSQNTHNVTAVVLPGVTPVPGGGVFAGAYFGPNITSAGDIAFPAIIPTQAGIHVPGEDYVGLGLGVFKADRVDQISKLVTPGDAAPGGGTFDFAAGPWSNDLGEVAFNGHIAGEEVLPPGLPPQADCIGAFTSVYLRKANGQLISIA